MVYQVCYKGVKKLRLALLVAKVYYYVRLGYVGIYYAVLGYDQYKTELVKPIPPLNRLMHVNVSIGTPEKLSGYPYKCDWIRGDKSNRGNHALSTIKADVAIPDVPQNQRHHIVGIPKPTCLCPKYP